MAREDRQTGANDGGMVDEATLLKRRARRRLIGAAALALFAAIVLPMIMDHLPAPALDDIQVRIPSPDEGAPQRVTPALQTGARIVIKPIAKGEPKVAAQAEPKVETKADPAPEAKAATTPAAPKRKPELRAESAAKATLAAPAASGESWEVQLGAYAEAGRVKNLVAKLKGLGLPAYTEKVDTPNGERTRVRAGPFPTQKAAEKAKRRIRIIGVDGSVARKPS